MSAIFDSDEPEKLISLVEIQAMVQPDIQEIQPELLSESQLKALLWQSLATASKFPETADVRSLCKILDVLIAHQPSSEQLNMAGEVLMWLSDICAARAEWMIEQWQHRHNPSEPVVNLDNCVDLFVQSLSLDMSELFEDPDPVQYPANRKTKLRPDETSSIAEDADKATLLSMLDSFTETQSEQPAMNPPTIELELADHIRNLAHNENVENWSKTIDRYLNDLKNTSKIRLIDLQSMTKMSIVELWLGLLLGGYPLEQQGEFYNVSHIWVASKND